MDKTKRDKNPRQLFTYTQTKFKKINQETSDSILFLFLLTIILTITTMNYLGFVILLLIFGFILRFNKQLAEVRQLIIDWQNREISRIKYEQK